MYKYLYMYMHVYVCLRLDMSRPIYPMQWASHVSRLSGHTDLLDLCDHWCQLNFSPGQCAGQNIANNIVYILLSLTIGVSSICHIFDAHLRAEKISMADGYESSILDR